MRLYEENLAERIRVLGPDDLKTQFSRYRLAEVYRKLGRSAAAIPHLEEALRIRTDKLGFDSPEARRTRRKLIEAYRSSGRSSDADVVEGAEHAARNN